jgi:hypothetical protein
MVRSAEKIFIEQLTSAGVAGDSLRFFSILYPPADENSFLSYKFAGNTNINFTIT